MSIHFSILPLNWFARIAKYMVSYTFFKGRNRFVKYYEELTNIETKTKTTRCSLLREHYSKSAMMTMQRGK